MESPTQINDSDGILEIDTLKQFTIPKRKKAKRDLFETIALDSREYLQDILQVLKLSYKDRESCRNFTYSRPRLVHNDQLLDEYAERKKQMRQDGYTEKEMQDVYGFLHVESEHEMRKICRDGLRTGNRKISCLGNPKMGVYLSKHADIITAEPLKSRQSGLVLLMRIIKGKVKFMVENRSGTPLEPTPNFDCHLLKTSNIDMSASSPQYVYECTQFYLYEYKDDAELSDRPRQIYPFAVADFRFQGTLSRDASRLGPPVLQQQMKAQATSNKATKKPWSGKTGSGLLNLEPSEPKKSRQRSGDSPGSKNPPQLSPKGDLKRNGSTATKDAAAVDSQALMRNAVLWSGELCCDGISVSNVQLLSFSLAFKPPGLRQCINVDSKVSLAYIQSQYLQPLKSFDRKVDLQIDGNHYFYACLVPVRAEDRAFKKFVDYLVSAESGVVCDLRDDSLSVMFPDCHISKHLGLSKDGSEFSGLHCIVIMKRTKSEYLVGEAEKRLPLQMSDDSESKTIPPIDAVNSALAEDDKGHDCPPGAAAKSSGGETPTEVDSEQTSESSQSRDPRLRGKPSQVKATKPSDVVRNRPSVVSHSRLVAVFDEMSKLQDKSNIDFARMLMMNRHGNASGSQSSANEPTIGFARTETDVFPKRPLNSQSSSGAVQHMVRPPLLSLPEKGNSWGVRQPMPGPTDVPGFPGPWNRRWPRGDAPRGSQQVLPTRQGPGQFPTPPSNGKFGWGQDSLYPPGPEFSAAQNSQREMLSPRAWEELRKNRHGPDAAKGPGPGRDPSQRSSDVRPSGPLAERTGQTARRNSDTRGTGHPADYPGADPGQYPTDQRYAGHVGGEYPQESGSMHPIDHRSSEMHAAYDVNRTMVDPRSGIRPGDHQGYGFNPRWPSDPRHGQYEEYQGQDREWWTNTQRTHGEWPNVCVPASENVRPGLLGDCPASGMIRHHSAKPRPSDSAAEPSSQNVARAADPRISRRSADPRTNRLSHNSAAGQISGTDGGRNHSSGAVLAGSEQS